jgi:hypothetical protein
VSAAWLEPAALDAWPSRPLASPALHYSLEVPASWEDSPSSTDAGTHREELLRGAGIDDGLLVQFMERADPAADIRGWAEAPLRLAGAPAAAIALADGERPELLEWREVPAPEGRWDADELALFEGLTRSAALLRVYTVLVRRGTLAWHVALALESACPPGTDAGTVQRSDHVRAAAVLGTLQLR